MATTLNVTLFVDPSAVVAGEHARMRVLLTNLGATAITVPDPERSRTWPKVIVTDASGRVSRSHRTEREGGGEFRVPLPEVWITLGPKQQVWLDDDLMRWIEPLAPGEYSLAVEHLCGTERPAVAVSAQRAVSIVALDAVWGSVVGAHGGESVMAMMAVVHRGQGGTALFETWARDHHGEPVCLDTVRTARCPPGARAVASTTMNGLAYPGHWLAWVDGDSLSGVWLRDGLTDGVVVQRALPTGGLELAQPILVELRGNDENASVRGVFALWNPRSLGAEVTFGALTSGALQPPLRALTIDEGVVVDVGGLNFSDGTMAFVVTAQCSDRVAISWVRGEMLSADNGLLGVLKIPGKYSAGAVCLGADDTVYGVALVLCEETHAGLKYGLVRWSLGAEVTLSAVTEVNFAERTKRVQSAVAGVGPKGSAVVLCLLEDGEWWAVDRTGGVESFDAGGAKVLSVGFLGDPKAFAVLATETSGVVWVPLGATVEDSGVDEESEAGEGL